MHVVCVCPSFVGEIRDAVHFKIFFLSSIYASDHVAHIDTADGNSQMNEMKHFLMKLCYSVCVGGGGGSEGNKRCGSLQKTFLQYLHK